MKTNCMFTWLLRSYWTFLLFLSFSSYAQTFEPSYGAPATPLQVCGSDAEFRVKINSGGTAVTGATLRITQPTGYAYTDGSAAYVSGGAGVITDTQVGSNANIYDLTVNIPASGSVEISYRAAATCAVIGSTGSGFVSYTLRSGTGTPALASNITGSSGAVNFDNAKLVINSVTNQNYSGTAGDTYTRDITITNTGYGSITGINLTSNNSAGLTITSPTVVSTTGSGSTALTVSGTAPNQTYTVAGVTLQQNQSIVIRENVQITSCSGSLTTAYDAWFGCTAKCTQSNVNGTQTAGASVTASKPVITFNSRTVVSPKCRGTDQLQLFSYKNTGAGTAQNLKVTLVSNTAGGTTMGYNASGAIEFQSGFKNLEYQVGGTSGAWTPLATTGNVFASGSVTQNCLTTAPIYTQATLPDLAPGAVIYIRYTEVTCCPSYCLSRGLMYPNNVVQFNYKDACNSSYSTDPFKLRAIGDGVSTLLGHNLPSDIVDGQTYDFKWDIGISGPDATYNNGTFKVVVTLPAGTVAPTAAQTGILLANGTTLSPASFSVAGNVLTATFNVTGSLSMLNGSQFQINDLAATCVGVTGNTSVGIQIYAAQPTCGCELNIGCLTSPIGTHCSPCPRGGLAFKNFSIQRVSYGLPDSDNNGIPDGSLDLSKIRTDYVMQGDTLVAVQYGKFVPATAPNTLPTLTHAYVKNTFSTRTGDFNALYASVQIFAAGSTTPTYSTTSSIPMTYASGTGSADISVDQLHAHGVPASYTAFATGDSIVVKTFYVVTGGAPAAGGNTAISVTNAMYASNVADPTNDTDMYYCDSFGGSFQLFDYAIRFSSFDLAQANVCGNVTVSPGYIMEFGVFQRNLSNFFPYEVRRLSYPKTVSVTVPAGYTFSSAAATYIAYGSSAGNVPVSPVDPNANPLVFNLDALFTSGAIKWGDEAINTWINVTFAVDCNTPAGNSTITATYTQDKAPSSSITLPAAWTTFNVNRTAVYTPGVIQMSSSQASVTTTGNTVSWVVAVKNGNSGTIIGTTLPNTWLAKQAGSGLTITSVQELASETAASGTVISPTAGGIYQLGDLAGNGTTKYYRVTGTLTSCTTTTLTLAYGYACHAYPSNVGAALCKNSFDLTAQAQPLSLQLTVLNQPGANQKYNLCDPVDYEIEVLNPSQGAGTTLKVIASLPSSGGVAYQPGSFQVKVPGSASYVAVSDANVSVSPTSITFSIPTANIDTLAQLEKYSIKFQVRTTACEFVSGSSLRFRPSGVDQCGTTKLGDNKQSNPIRLTEAPDTYNTFTITSDVQPVTACGTSAVSTNYHYKMVNNNAATAIVYSFEIEVPAPWEMASPSSLSFGSGSYTGVTYQGVTTNAAGNKVYAFNIASGMGSGAYVEFTEPLTAPNASALSCGVSDPIKETALLAFQATCSLDGTVCTTKQIVSENETSTIQVNKPDYSVAALTATKTSETTVSGTVTINNGSSTYVAQNGVLKLYKDADGNGAYSAGDVLIGSQTLTLANSASQTLPYSVTSSYAGNICPLVAVVEIACSCSPAPSLPYTCNIPLPVSFAAFTAKADGNSAKLEWVTASELNNAFFEVQHSVNARDFETVGTVSGNGTTQVKHTYTFTHTGLSAESIHYYRLKQVDLDGKFTYSQTRSVQLDGYKGILMRVSPNPVSDRTLKASVEYGDDALPSAADLIVTDANGRAVDRLSAELKKGLNTFAFRLDSQPAGTYLLTLKNAGLPKPIVVKVIVR